MNQENITRWKEVSVLGTDFHGQKENDRRVELVTFLFNVYVLRYLHVARGSW